jgi:hypothetical protein
MPRGDGYAPANADVVLAGTSIMRPKVVVFTWQGAEKSAIWKKRTCNRLYAGNPITPNQWVTDMPHPVNCSGATINRLFP